MSCIEPRQIDHVVLLVTDLDQSQAYYEALFNFQGHSHATTADTRMVESPHLHFFFIEMQLPDQFRRQQHLSLRVDNYDDVIAALKEHRIQYLEGVCFQRL